MKKLSILFFLIAICIGCNQTRTSENNTKPAPKKETLTTQSMPEVRIKEENDSVLYVPETKLRLQPQQMSQKAVLEMLRKNDFYCKPEIIAGGKTFGNSEGKGAQNTFKLMHDDLAVYDSATNLYWQKSGSPTRLNFEASLKYVQDLNASNFGGISNWRIPTTEEAMSLMTRKENAQAIYFSELFNPVQYKIWTSDSLGYSWVFKENTGWKVDYKRPDIWFDVKKSARYYVKATALGDRKL